MAVTSRRRFMQTTAAVAAGTVLGGAAERSSLQAADAPPQPPKRLEVNHDLHTHTLYSDGAHPISLHVLEARAFELDAIAITDHYAPGGKIQKSEEEFDRYLAEIGQNRAGQSDVIVLQGVEATALDATGKISIDEKHAARLEWILCDLGGFSEGTLLHPPADKQKYIENVVRTYMGLCDVTYLDAIAHPFNTGNTAPPALPADYPPRLLRELAAKMAEKKKVFDVMNDTIYWFSKAGIAPRALTAQYVEVVKLFAREGVVFQVSSDDHRTGLGNTRWSEIVLARAGVPRSQVVDPRKIAARGKKG
jgi:histidinol phosphatase-like PHP family hydrolase